VAVIVPAGYVFEDDTCDNAIGSRCPRSDLPWRGKKEAAEVPKRNLARVKREEPEGGGAQPAVRRRRGRPKKAERPSATGEGPQAGEQGVTEAAVGAETPQETGNQTPATRRGRARDPGPRGQRDRGRNC
jgi:hypothetical protein